jgi:hypothetical protein
MIALEVPQVGERPVRSADLPKRETGTGPQHVGKGMDWETVYQSMPFRDLDVMGNAELLEVQWSVGGWYSLDTMVVVKP